MSCRYCIKFCQLRQIVAQDNIFISEACIKVKKDNLVKHEKRNLHMRGTWFFGSDIEPENLEKNCFKECSEY